MFLKNTGIRHNIVHSDLYTQPDEKLSHCMNVYSQVVSKVLNLPHYS